ncbi:MAG: hypothetical protein Q8R87_04105 [Anaerolineaceae bacterium]|nr:hypothetical protein [Anaerolineaceae bacterium]
MNPEIIYASPFATLWYHHESKIIHHMAHEDYGAWESDEFRNMVMLGTRTMAERGAQKWLSDDRFSLSVNKEEFRWGAEHWFPVTIKAGWKHWAIVKPKHVIAQLNMEKTVKDYKAQGINAMFFSDVDEAMQWLEDQ